SEPKYSSSQVAAPPVGQLGEGGSEYRAAKLCSRLSLSGRPPAPSFHAHWLMSCGSFDPPPVKMVAFGLGSATQSTAVAPLVSPADVHSGVVAVLVTWWQTLSQASPRAAPLGALPSSSNAPGAGTACAGPIPKVVIASAVVTAASTAIHHRFVLRLCLPGLVRIDCSPE